MTVTGHLDDKVHVPAEVKASMKGTEVTVKGSKGQVTRDFGHPKVKVTLKDDHFHIECEYPRTKEKALVGTYAAHLKNMVEGANHGFEYYMKVVYSHFPMKLAVKGEKFVIENFLGEKSPRHANILGQTKVVVKGAEVVVSGINLEEVSQTAANIERACRIKGYDPRVFQDGIYIVEKARKVKA
ncbi:MAG: 50S ribosomal protein L6 [Methanomassiliicoccales archaeon]|nr:50S ribosomal protein L6 [Methanomassiliicoccales archaeon]